MDRAEPDDSVMTPSVELDRAEPGDSVMARSVELDRANDPIAPCSPISSTALVTAEAPEPEVIPPAIASLRNLGNTCFLNSVLQVLRYTPNFIENMNELAHHSKITLKEKCATNDKNDNWHKEDSGDLEACNDIVSVHAFLSRITPLLTYYNHSL